MIDIKCPECGALLKKKDIKKDTCWQCKAKGVEEKVANEKAKEAKEAKETVDKMEQMAKKKSTEKQKKAEEEAKRKAEEAKRKARSAAWQKSNASMRAKGASIRNTYLSLYRGLCWISLIVIPFVYMEAQFKVWKIQMQTRGLGPSHWKDGFLLDGWLDFDGYTTFNHIDYYGIDLFILYPFLAIFLGVLAMIKIITLLFELDDKRYEGD